MKRTLMTGILIVLSAVTAFAYGYGRGGYNDGGRGWGGGPGRGGYGNPGFGRGGGYYGVTGEAAKSEGSLVLEEGTMPYLNTKEGKVFLMLPPAVIYGLELKGGEAVKAEGHTMPSQSWNQESESAFLRVISLEVNGEKVDMFPPSGPGGWGPGGGRGPGGW